MNDHASDTRLPVSRLASPLGSLPSLSELNAAYLAYVSLPIIPSNFHLTKGRDARWS